MKFVQYKEDVIWKEGRMCLRGKPFEVEDQYAFSVFSIDPRFESLKENENEEEVQEASPQPEVLKGKACTKCGKLIHMGWYFHDKNCKGPK
jgi:hypothetical protein